MTYAEYMREYRVRNRDRLRIYEKARNGRRRANAGKALESSKSHRCMTSYCNSTVTESYDIDGMTVWLCSDHKPKIK